MQLDINQILATFDPWDLELKIGDRVYPIRPITNVDLENLRNISGISAEHQRTAFLGLLGIYPARDDAIADAITDDQLIAAGAVILAYFKEKTAKKVERIADHARATMRSGTSGKPSR